MQTKTNGIIMDFGEWNMRDILNSAEKGCCKTSMESNSPLRFVIRLALKNDQKSSLTSVSPLKTPLVDSAGFVCFVEEPELSILISIPEFLFFSDSLFCSS